ncbi:NPCBM/NEW2 domain-containing protein [Salinactinospora qingdaonensis]|uniref:Glycosyl hydrolase family 98 putative carbohydrate-binding module domain-containing protein n=1 Tax=Salinactinospora qingdaonensis TaxID=702744 RepID=A0ABP7FQ83_9ACTN
MGGGLAVLALLCLVVGAAGTYYLMRPGGPLAAFPTTEVSPGAADASPRQQAAGEPETTGGAESLTEQQPQPGTHEATSSASTAPSSPSEAASAAEDAAVPESQSLTSMEWVDTSGADWESDPVTVNATEYSRVLSTRQCYHGEEWLEFNLSREWQTLTSTVGIADTSDSGASVTFTVYVDGEQMASETTTLGEEVALDVDVSDALRVRLQVQYEEPCATAVWAQPLVTR